MKRRHNDTVADGMGDSGTDGQDFVTPGPDQQFGYPGQRSRESSYAGKYTSNNSGLTRTDNYEGRDGSRYGGSVSRSLYDDIMENDRPGGNFDSTGPVRSGINKKQ